MNRLILIGLLILLGCDSYKKSFDSTRIQLVKSKVWNLYIPDTIGKSNINDLKILRYKVLFTDFEMFFIEDQLYMRSLEGIQNFYDFKNDTFLMTSSYVTSGQDSSYRVMDTIFMGKIINVTSDSLIFLRQKDKIFSYILGDIDKCNTIKFYNDSLIMGIETDFKTISLSSGPCYGKCPMRKVEVDNKGIIHYYGGLHSYRIGSYKGLLRAETMDSIKHMLSAAIINKEVLKYYGVADDAPGTEMKIVFENFDTITIDGDANSFNYRLWQICNRLNRSIAIDSLKKDSVKFNFLANKYFIE